MDKKIFLHVDEQELAPINLDFVSISDIDKYEDNSIKEISIQDLLDYIPENDVSQTMDTIVSKLEPDGIIHIQGTDLKQLSIAVAFNKVESKLIRNILYPHKKSISTLRAVIELLKSLDMDIQEKKFVNIFEYYVSAKKKQNIQAE